MENRREKAAIEAMLYTWGEPLEVRAIAGALSIDTKDAYDIVIELQKEYEEGDRGIVIRRVDKSFYFATNKDVSEYVKKLCTPTKRRRLSQSALEVLAIIAYKQPVTKGEIESIRGIRCERVVDTLMSKNLVVEVGRSDGVGRPILYGTTKEFLHYLGLEDLKELPNVDVELENIVEDHMENKLDYQQISVESFGVKEYEDIDLNGK